jgi:ankyrin repeat protein
MQLCLVVLLITASSSLAGRSKRKPGYSSTIQLVPDDPPLFRACEHGNLRMAQIAYQEHKDDVNLADNRGHTGLHWASTNNHLHMVEWLLKLPGIDVNAIDKDHLTPLHIASHGGHYKIVRLLLEAGADQHMQVRYVFSFKPTLCFSRHISTPPSHTHTHAPSPLSSTRIHTYTKIQTRVPAHTRTPQTYTFTSHTDVDSPLPSGFTCAPFR